MEKRGILLDLKKLSRLEKEVESGVKKLRKKIVDLSGRDDINFDSPNQLQRLLFDDLKIPTRSIKKTKTGFSTNSEVLSKLSKEYPIAGLLLEYRELQKLLNTYLRPLPKMVESDGRLHTTYGLETSTGRISSKNPNLQNIPIRSELGKAIRSAFIASRGRVLLKADYSQIELRLAATLSGDRVMNEAFRTGKDIHAATAAAIFQKPLAEVTEDDRRAAKTVNFGVLYGMGPHGLSVALSVPFDEAKDYIESYFSVHKDLKDYIEGATKRARKTGQVETLFGRVRKIAELDSPIGSVRRAGERMAVNMPIQGLAAEILKLAMIEVEKKLGSEAALLLTVHDELLFEVEKAKALKVGMKVKALMEGVLDLPIPIRIHLALGRNWGEMEEPKIIQDLR